MTYEDPFYVVKDEVFRALNKTRGLYVRWAEAGDGDGDVISSSASDAELRNALRSIDWDLEDLEDTISIVEKNAKKIDYQEMVSRKSFIEATKQEVQAMRGKVAASGASGGCGRRLGSAGYARLANADGDSPARHTASLDHHQLSSHSSLQLDDHNMLETCDVPPTTSTLPCDQHCSLPNQSSRLLLLGTRLHWIAICVLLPALIITLLLMFIIL